MPLRFSDLEGRRVAVWGWGRETRALAEQLRLRLGSRPTIIVSDSAIDAAELDNYPIVAGRDALDACLRCDVVVRSPGVSMYRPELVALRARGVPVVTATGLWLAEPRSAPVIGVTGTKGKSTTAALVAHLLSACGLTVELAGNIGRPAIELLAVPAPECYVLELSSYQIADLAVGADVVLFTNLFPEHVDWHGTVERYFGDKLRLATCPPARTVIVNECDSRLRTHIERVRPIGYGCDGRFTCDLDQVFDDGRPVLSHDEIPLRGRHNLVNVCGALTAATTVAELPGDLHHVFKGFDALPHRLQSLGTSGGIEWVDDSISTTPESTIAALAAFPGAVVIMIGGGFDRQQDYTELAAALAERDAFVIGVPSTGARLLAAAAAAGMRTDRLQAVADLEEAVAWAHGIASPGSVVLLSPAAPSFGEFSSFEQRGDRFAALAGFAPTTSPRGRGGVSVE